MIKRLIHSILAALCLGVASATVYTTDIAPGATQDLTSAQGVADGGTITLTWRGPLDVQMQTGGASEWLTISSSQSSGMKTLPIVGGTVRLSVPATATASSAVAATISTGTPIGGPSGGTAVVQENDVLTVSSSQSGVATYWTQDTTGYRSVAVQTIAVGTSATLVAEVSNDNSNWQTTLGYSTSAGGSSGPSGNPSSTLGALTIYPTSGRYFRVRSTAQVGSYTVQGVFRSGPIPNLQTFIGGGPTGSTALNVQGNAASGTTASGNPFRTGVIVQSAPAVRTAGQMADVLATLYGVPTNKPFSIPELDWSYVPPSGALNGSATAVAIKAAAGAGIRNYITGLTISADTLSAACDLVILDGSTVIYRQHLQTAGLAGQTVEFHSPLKSTANTALNIQTQVSGTGTAVTGGIYVNAWGYAAP